MFSPALRRLVAILLLFTLGLACLQNIASASSSDASSAIFSVDADASDDATPDRTALLSDSCTSAWAPQRSSFPRSPDVIFRADPGLAPPSPPPESA
ncbi:MAG: hypothetical protein PHH47_07500 [Gallionella sp.]|nr:hypothetical protein [Gallionella sp.]MDD4945366.1 hypothetical protein [Gallionella sp.]